jgi:hypothetical protein
MTQRPRWRHPTGIDCRQPENESEADDEADWNPEPRTLNPFHPTPAPDPYTLW